MAYVTTIQLSMKKMKQLHAQLTTRRSEPRKSCLAQGQDEG